MELQHLAEVSRNEAIVFGHRLILGEGIETVLTAMEATSLPGWATLGTSGLANIVLPGVREIIVLAENDDGASQRAIDKACPALVGRAIKVRVAAPPQGYGDFNDLVKGDGVERGSGLMIAKMAIEFGDGMAAEETNQSQGRRSRRGEVRAARGWPVQARKGAMAFCLFVIRGARGRARRGVGKPDARLEPVAPVPGQGRRRLRRGRHYANVARRP